MRTARIRWYVLLLVVVAATCATLFACTQTPPPVPLRTFERAQRLDVVCLRIHLDSPPEPLPQEACAPIAASENGANRTNQLFGLVTQTGRGELAVVGLSAGRVIDPSRSVPGTTFLPIGANPTDIAVTPDGRMAFVGSAEPNKFAIYGIPGHRILGDESPVADPYGPTTLSSWPACALPERPGSLTVIPRRSSVNPSGDAGAPSDSGAPYELVVVLPGSRSTKAKIVTVDPRPFLRATPRRSTSGVVLEDPGAGPALGLGQLEACPITSAIELRGEESIPSTVRSGRSWNDGVPWVDGGVDLACERPEQATRCGLRSCACSDPTTGLDAGALIDRAADAGVSPGAVACALGADAGASVEQPFDLGPLDPPQPVAIARDDRMLYVADVGVPLIHAIDFSAPGAPRELAPFVVTSDANLSRAVSIRALAVSPTTREYKRYLYAVDRQEGSLAVFDITDPQTAERLPMRRPHPELNPFQPPDRIAFSAPVVAVTFARHDYPIERINAVALANPPSGLLCNPNPSARLDPALGESAADYGVFYRAGSESADVPLGPQRLRGIFAFATLSDGKVVTIDVDDWDAPCRRPELLRGASPDGLASTPLLAVAQPSLGEGDLDPYHAPTAASGSVTGEVFFPVSAPHRPRSAFFLRDDAQSGRHTPFLQAAPSLSALGDVAPALVGPGSEFSPKLRPTAATRGGSPDGTKDVGVRFSLDTPEVHFSQDWSVTYEGALPGFEGLPANLSTTDRYESLVFSQPQARFCSKGVEDWTVSGERANAVTNALALAGRPAYAERIDRRMIDYVQILDELLPASDAFWRLPDVPEPNGCWDERLNPSNPGDPAAVESSARSRYDVCAGYFGSASQQSPNRDFPILEAYDDRLVVGRFATIGSNKTRELVYKDASNAAYLKLARCCFHHQVKFGVRAGSQWVTLGSSVGFLSHTETAEGGRCVSSCESRKSLLNARAPSLPPGDASGATPDFAPFRDSPLAMRNPSFSFFVQEGLRRPERGMAFRFQTGGEFRPVTIGIGGASGAVGALVNPQSMRFIESLGQVAVIDATSQGLVLLDLRRLAVARAPYF
jgi:hypothetical protein